MKNYSISVKRIIVILALIVLISMIPASYALADIENVPEGAAIESIEQDDQETTPEPVETSEIDETLTEAVETQAGVIDSIDSVDSVMPQSAIPARSAGIDATIDLSESTTGNHSLGYEIIGNTDPPMTYSKFASIWGHTPLLPTYANAELIIKTSANGRTFRIIQSGVLSSPADPAAPKNGTAIIPFISIEDNVHVTLILEDIDLGTNGKNGLWGSLDLHRGSELTLLLGTDTQYTGKAASSYIRDAISTGTSSTLIVDSAKKSGSPDGALKVTSRYAHNAAIGGNVYGTTGMDSGKVIIKGGTITAVSDGNGAAIGGAGITNNDYGQAGNGNVTISGGKVTAINTGNGAAIGGGAAIGTYSTSGGGNISIIDGVVTASGNHGAGIGGGATGYLSKGTYDRILKLDAKANVKACSSGNDIINGSFHVYHKTAIDTNNNNTGNGYYVNAKLNEAVSNTASATVSVYANNGTSFKKALSLPANYRCFGYSTDSGTARTDSILAQAGSEPEREVVRVHDDSPEIYSIIKLNGYNSHNNNAANGTLPVKFKGKSVHRIIEKFVDVNGDPLEPMMADNLINIPIANPVYSKVIPAVNGYEALGYYVGNTFDATSDTYTSGSSIVINPVTKNTIVYFVYRKLPDHTTLTITNTLAGDYRNTMKDFTFTVSFKDSNGMALAPGTKFNYSSGTFGSGVLTLDGNGEASFVLKHNQMITIEDVVQGSKVRIVQKEDPTYNTSYKDNEGPDGGYDTGVLVVTQNPRFISFINERKPVTESGIDAVDVKDMITLPVLSLLLVLASSMAKTVMRRSRGVR